MGNPKTIKRYRVTKPSSEDKGYIEEETEEQREDYPPATNHTISRVVAIIAWIVVIGMALYYWYFGVGGTNWLWFALLFIFACVVSVVSDLN